MFPGVLLCAPDERSRTRRSGAPAHALPEGPARRARLGAIHAGRPLGRGTPDQGAVHGGAPAPAPFTPAARWVAEHQIKVLCMVVATASPILSLWMLARGTANLRQGIWAYSVDGAGTIHYWPVGPADARSALFREILLQAAQ